MRSALMIFTESQSFVLPMCVYLHAEVLPLLQLACYSGFLPFWQYLQK